MNRKNLPRLIVLTIALAVLILLVYVGNCYLFNYSFKGIEPENTKNQVRSRLSLWTPTQKVFIGEKWEVWLYDVCPRISGFGSTTSTHLENTTDFVEPYEKFEILYDSEGTVRATVLSGESSYVETDLGKIKGGGLYHYFKAIDEFDDSQLEVDSR